MYNNSCVCLRVLYIDKETVHICSTAHCPTSSGLSFKCFWKRPQSWETTYKTAGLLSLMILRVRRGFRWFCQIVHGLLWTTSATHYITRYLLCLSAIIWQISRHIMRNIMPSHLPSALELKAQVCLIPHLCPISYHVCVMLLTLQSAPEHEGEIKSLTKSLI